MKRASKPTNQNDDRAIKYAQSFNRIQLSYSPIDCSSPGFSVHGIIPGKNTGMGCHFLPQGIFPTQGLNRGLSCLLHWQVGSSPLVPLGSPSEERGLHYFHFTGQNPEPGASLENLTRNLHPFRRRAQRSWKSFTTGCRLTRK